MILDRFRLDGRLAIVTGAGSGLGRAFALSLAEAGAAVACLDRDVEGLVETVAGISGDQGLTLRCDVADVDQVKEAITAAKDWKGVPHILINNAGIACAPARIHELAVDDWDRVVATNLRSVFLMSRAVLPLMMGEGRGAIVNLGSFLGLVGAYPGFPITAACYAASKAAVDGLTRQMAVEYAKDGIRVNGIAPGWHGGTRLGRERRSKSDPAQIEAFESFIAQSVPMGHRGTPDDLVGLLLYLASDASLYVTGQSFAHDGGLLAS